MEQPECVIAATEATLVSYFIVNRIKIKKLNKKNLASSAQRELDFFFSDKTKLKVVAS
jgi:hypothetical protein